MATVEGAFNMPVDLTTLICVLRNSATDWLQVRMISHLYPFFIYPFFLKHSKTRVRTYSRILLLIEEPLLRCEHRQSTAVQFSEAKIK